MGCKMADILDPRSHWVKRENLVDWNRAFGPIPDPPVEHTYTTYFNSIQVLFSSMIKLQYASIICIVGWSSNYVFEYNQGVRICNSV